ncbi:MAG: hypothetical protein COA74_01905 [Gammaproteobacteria bacterium]|nr:MAG: hypothetical protein COA74_01905 [Gammaproteobacteria bacterium]
MDVSNNNCFHCGLTIPAGSVFEVKFEDSVEFTCCPGCQTVCRCILDSGLSNFYKYRTAYAEPVKVAESQTTDSSDRNKQNSENWHYFDTEEIQVGFVRNIENGHKRLELQIQGMVCAACVWLLQRKLESLVAVKQVCLNLERQSLRLDFDPKTIKVSDVFAAIESCGYRPYPWIEDVVELRRQQENNQHLKRLAVAGLGTMQVMMLTLGLYSSDMPQLGSYASLLKWTSLIFATAVVFYSAQVFFTGALRDLSNRRVGMDVPVALAIAVAYIASLVSTVRGVGAVYYESVTMFSFLLLLGRYLELKVRWQMSRQDRNLAELLPLKCCLKTTGGEKWVTPLQLKIGDRVIIKAGERVPVDGEVTDGDGYFDESALTGEFMAKRHGCGETVLAGSILCDGFVEIKVLRNVEQSAVSVILDLMSLTTKHKSTSLSLAHKIASIFISLILILAVLVGSYWWVVDASMVLPVVVSLLVVSCPCALSLATPVAHTAASIGLRKQGILLVENKVIDEIFNVTDVIFDKTGTLTTGQISIKKTTCFSDLNIAFCNRLAAGLEKASAHPIASAFKGFDTVDMSDVEVLSGRGITGTYQDKNYAIGSREYILEFSPSVDKLLLDELNSQRRIFLVDHKQLIASFTLYDPLKHDVTSTLNDPWLKSLTRHLLSGDTSAEVQRLAKQLEFNQMLSGVSADKKKQYVSDLSASGKFTMTLGDGVNDGPVLAASGISIAVAEATSLAQSRADVIFLSPGLGSLLQLQQMAIKTKTIIRQNYGWTFAYNIIAIPFAVSGLMVPWIAALGMSLSSLLVVLNATRLIRYPDKPQASLKTLLPPLTEPRTGTI